MPWSRPRLLDWLMHYSENATWCDSHYAAGITVATDYSAAGATTEADAEREGIMKRPRHYTSWAGVLAVASELSRRQYDAALTLGNTPRTDLICTSPSGRSFRVQVKATSTRTAIRIQRGFLEGPAQDNLLLVVALVPLEEKSPYEYFVLTHSEVTDAWSARRTAKRDGTPHRPGHDGLNWGTIAEHRDQWTKLPD